MSMRMKMSEAIVAQYSNMSGVTVRPGIRNHGHKNHIRIRISPSVHVVERRCSPSLESFIFLYWAVRAILFD